MLTAVKNGGGGRSKLDALVGLKTPETPAEKKPFRKVDGVGFEPTNDFRRCRFSRPVHSTALPPIPTATFAQRLKADIAVASLIAARGRTSLPAVRKGRAADASSGYAV